MQKNIQKKLLMIIAILILSLAISGAVSAEDGTENNLTENDTLNQTLPDPRIEHNGVIGPTVYATIQDAINAAQSGDTIWLEDGATFTTGQVWRPAIVHVTKNLSFRVFNDGTATISGTNTRRAIYVDSGVTANFYNITITQGRSLNPLLYDGAGIFNNGGTVNLYNCILDNNDGLWRGGGIYNNQGTVRIENTMIRNNNVPFSGGAIYNNQGTVNIVSSTITGNSARNGGGIYNNDGTVTIENSNLISNSVSGTGTNNGGAVYNDNGDLFIYGSNILNNAASNEGGAVYATTGTTNTIQYNRIIGNSDRVLYREGSSNIDARFNWWGSNTGPTSGMYRNANVNPYIRLTINPVGPTNLINTGNYLITAEIFRDSSGGDHSGAAYHVPDGPISFSILPTVWGSLSNVDTVMTNAHAYATFNANSGARPTNPVVVQALVDNVAVTTAFNILPAADLWLTSKDVDDSTPDIGQLIKYTITVINNGPDTATDVSVTDLLPAGLTFDHYQATAGTYSGGIWSIPTLATNAVLEIWATVNAHPTSPTATNTATVSSPVYDPNPNNNQDSETIYFPVADITLAKEFREGYDWDAGPITTAHYLYNVWAVIKAHNNGPDAATNVFIQDNLPAGLTNTYNWYSVSYDGGFTWTYGPDGSYDFGTGIWTINSIASGAEYWLAIWTTVTSTGDKINQAAVTQLDQYYTTLSTTQATLHVPQEAALTLQKEFRSTIDGEPINEAQYGQQVYVIVRLHNNGPDDATNINIHDVYNGFDYQGGYWVNYGSGWIAGDTTSPFDGADWTIPFLGNGQTIWLAISGPVEVTGTGVVNNTANQTSQDQYTPSLPGAFASLDVPPAAYLTVNKEFRATYNGSAITQANYPNWIWTVLQAWNNGPDDVWAIIKDTPHAGLVLNNSGWYYSIDGGATWNPGDGAYSIYNPLTHEWRIWMPELTESSTCYYLAIPTLVNQTGTLSNVVEQTWQDVYAPEPFDNNTVNLQVPPAADVFVNITPSKTKLTVGETMVVRVKVGNNGPDSAQNVVVTYKIPAGMDFVSLTHEAGYPAPEYDPATHTVTWNLGDLAVIDPWMDITLRAVGAGTTSSDASVISDTYDPVPSNNVEAVTITVEQAKVKAATVPMQPTGIPIAGLVLAVLMLSAGLLMPKRK